MHFYDSLMLSRHRPSAVARATLFSDLFFAHFEDLFFIFYKSVIVSGCALVCVCVSNDSIYECNILFFNRQMASYTTVD